MATVNSTSSSVAETMLVSAAPYHTGSKLVIRFFGPPRLLSTVKTLHEGPPLSKSNFTTVKALYNQLATILAVPQMLLTVQYLFPSKCKPSTQPHHSPFHPPIHKVHSSGSYPPTHHNRSNYCNFSLQGSTTLFF